MLEIARARARELGREVDLRLGDARALEFADQSFDTVVCTLSPCTIPDDRAAVAEVRRVLCPGGRFFNHGGHLATELDAGSREVEPPAPWDGQCQARPARRKPETAYSQDFRVGRAGIEPATLGLKVLQIRHSLNGKTPFQRFWEAVSGRGTERHLTTFIVLDDPLQPRSLPSLAYLVGGERSAWCVAGVFARRS